MKERKKERKKRRKKEKKEERKEEGKTTLTNLLFRLDTKKSILCFIRACNKAFFDEQAGFSKIH